MSVLRQITEINLAASCFDRHLVEHSAICNFFEAGILTILAFLTRVASHSGHEKAVTKEGPMFWTHFYHLFSRQK